MDRRPTRLAIGLSTILIVALLALNVTGVVPIPTGPLGDHQPAVPDNARTTLNHDPQASAQYLTALVNNTGPVAVTIVRVTPIGTSVPGSVEVLGSKIFNRDDPAEYGPDGMSQIVLGIQPDPGPGWTTPQPVTGVTVEPEGSAQRQGRAFLVRVTPDPARETVVLRFDVEYAIGPFHFVTTAWGPLGTTLVICPRDRPVGGQDGCEAA